MKKIILATFLFYSIHSKAQNFPDSVLRIFPDTSWQTLKEPSKEGWDTSKLTRLRRYTIDSTHITGMIIIYFGKVLTAFGDTAELSLSASVRKSILSILFGSFVENGKLNLSKTLAQLNFEDKGGLLPIEKQATLFDLMTSRAAIFRESGNPVGDEYLIATKGV
jgi:hypothetical protein